PPPGDTLRTEARDQGIAALQLAPGRQHAAGKPGARTRAELRAALEDLHGDAALGELERAGEPCDPGPDDGDAHGFQRSRGAGAGTYSSLPPARNLAALSRMPGPRASAPTSCEMRLEQNFRRHRAQKSATVAPSIG